MNGVRELMTGGHHGMNGQHQVNLSGPASEGQPLVTISPPAIRITGAQIWAAILAIPATVALLTSQGWLYVPAKDSEVQPLVAIVQTLQKGQEDTTQAIRRLTEAVDNISGLVAKLPKPKNATGALKLR
jgi:hypothetical protein